MAHDQLNPLIAPIVHSRSWLVGQGHGAALPLEQLGLRVTQPPAQWLRDILGPTHTLQWGETLARALTKAGCGHGVQVVEHESISGLEFDPDR
jgi:hypothetical protein